MMDRNETEPRKLMTTACCQRLGVLARSSLGELSQTGLGDVPRNLSPNVKGSVQKRFSISKRFKVGSSPLTPFRKVGYALQKSLSTQSLRLTPTYKYVVTPSHQRSRVAPPKRRLSFWHETVDHFEGLKLDRCQLDRQEAIFELYRSEVDLLDDLIMVKKMYHDSMKMLGLLNEIELEQLFGHLDVLASLHQELAEVLSRLRLANGMTYSVGFALLSWVPKLICYVPYCANLVLAKSLLDTKKQEPAIADFLERCQESPFSRKLDLWSFLDIPRSRMVKYPLLFQNILKHTPINHEDVPLIEKATNIVRMTIEETDVQMGRSKCHFVIKKLHFTNDKQRHPLIYSSSLIICDGILKNNRGLKLQVFLFEKVLVVTRHILHGKTLRYQVHQQPIPLSLLTVTDLPLESSKGGSFKTSLFSSTQKAKHSFRLQVKHDSLRKSCYTFHATDEADKMHWLQCLQSAISVEMKTSPYALMRFSGCSQNSDQERLSLTNSLSSNSVYSASSSQPSRSSSEENLDGDGLFCLSANCGVEFC